MRGSFIEAWLELWDCGDMRRWTARAARPATGSRRGKRVWGPWGQTDGRMNRMKRILALSLALAAAISVSALRRRRSSRTPSSAERWAPGRAP